LTNVAEYEVRDTDDGVLMMLHREGPRILGLRLSNEATIASIVSVSQQASSRPFHPLKVFFKHSGPGDSHKHEHHFKCPVEFNSNMDALLVSSESVSTPNKVGDPSIAKFFDHHLDQTLEKLEDDSELCRRIRICVSQQLSEGVPTVSQIAKSLGMSGRTLQRRLSDYGYSFQSLVDEARRQLAEKLLRETEYPLIEVAFLTGFSEQSAFTRAFKRWAGQTPRSFRLKL
jgi:AraC-like DNA-binding protein